MGEAAISRPHKVDMASNLARKIVEEWDDIKNYLFDFNVKIAFSAKDVAAGNWFDIQAVNTAKKQITVQSERGVVVTCDINSIGYASS